MSAKYYKENCMTDKYKCKKCGKQMMYPNVAYGIVEGYKCANCGTVNHPVRDILNLKPLSNKSVTKKADEKKADEKKVDETPIKMPSIISIDGTDFIVCGYGCDADIWLKPKHMRRGSSYVISDPNGSLFRSYGRAFEQFDYNVKVLNTSNISESIGYNPFTYVKDNSAASKLAAALINGTEGRGKPGAINFLSAETALFTALISYICLKGPKNEANIKTLIDFIDNMYIYADEELNSSTAVIMLNELKKTELKHSSVRQFNKFKERAGKKAKSVIESCAERLDQLDTEEIRSFLSKDELDDLFYSHTVLFIITKDNGVTLDFIAPLMYSQLINMLHERSVR